jgi:hypothetical protein
LQYSILRLLCLFLLFGCQSSNDSNESITTDTTGLANSQNQVDTMPSPKNEIFFDTTVTFEQFRAELGEFSMVFAQDTPPKSCEEYMLRFISEFRSGHLQDDSLLYKYSLCEDLSKFQNINEETAKTDESYGLWHYEFKAIGEKYFVIRGTQIVGSIREAWYYYQRKE